MRDAYFAPERIIHEGGIDPIIRGSFAQPAQKVDTKVRLEVFRFMEIGKTGLMLESNREYIYIFGPDNCKTIAKEPILAPFIVVKPAPCDSNAAL